jgi:GxxExxY protein
MGAKATKMDDLEKLTHIVIGCALRIHTKLGPGLFESVYHAVMFRDLVSQDLFVESKKSVGFEFEGHWFENAFVPHLIVERCLVVEIKSQKQLKPIDQKQVHTYLRILDYRVGLLLNFGEEHLKDGIKRVINNRQRKYRSSLPSFTSLPSRENGMNR